MLKTMAVAVAEQDGTVRSMGTIANNPEAIARLFRKLGDKATLNVCYEAGPCGYVLYWQVLKLGHECVVVAPTLIPVKAGDRVKTDRRDAEKLAWCDPSGDLTAVWSPMRSTKRCGTSSARGTRPRRTPWPSPSPYECEHANADDRRVGEPDIT